MTILTMAMALSVGVGFTVWMSDLPLVAQIIIAVIMIAKTVLFFCAAWMVEMIRSEKAEHPY